MTGHIIVRDGGLATTVQDLGRPGYQSLGLPVSGALDPVSLRLANTLVGNAEGETALEIRSLGPTLEIEADMVRVALAGTGTPMEIRGAEPRSVPAGQSATVRRGDILRIGATPDTACCVLAIAGGLALPAAFGSRATYLRGGLGGFEGRPLRPGDRLPLANDPVVGPERQLTCALPHDRERRLRVVLGPQAGHFNEVGIKQFLSSRYRVSIQSDRMGIRLEGPRIAHAKGHDIASDGIVTGAVQVPGTGLPIILMADRQTTGGYPKIACVISADLPRLGRLQPGDTVMFEALTVAAAEAARRAEESDIASVIGAIRPVLHGSETLDRALMTENLITGGEWLREEGPGAAIS